MATKESKDTSSGGDVVVNIYNPEKAKRSAEEIQSAATENVPGQPNEEMESSATSKSSTTSAEEK